MSGGPLPDNASVRRPHAVLDLPSRHSKALKIERLLGLSAGVDSARLLEIGTGSGGIAHYFASHASGRYEVDAVDVVDNRQVEDGYRFTLVSGTLLPFADASFDVVISNHVIEHVGDEEQQRAHLAELRRVLRDTGIAYFAVPNRWMLVEPHYRLTFLSWLPPAWRTPYLRWSGKGEHYDCRPLTARQALLLLSSAGFACKQQCGNAVLLTYEIERPSAPIYRFFLRWLPVWSFRIFAAAIPTLIYTLRPMPPTAVATNR